MRVLLDAVQQALSYPFSVSLVPFCRGTYRNKYPPDKVNHLLSDAVLD
jgi:hypothetical protein